MCGKRKIPRIRRHGLRQALPLMFPPRSKAEVTQRELLPTSPWERPQGAELAGAGQGERESACEAPWRGRKTPRTRIAQDHGADSGKQAEGPHRCDREPGPLVSGVRLQRRGLWHHSLCPWRQMGLGPALPAPAPAAPAPHALPAPMPPALPAPAPAAPCPLPSQPLCPLPRAHCPPSPCAPYPPSPRAPCPPSPHAPCPPSPLPSQPPSPLPRAPACVHGVESRQPRPAEPRAPPPPPSGPATAKLAGSGLQASRRRDWLRGHAGKGWPGRPERPRLELPWTTQVNTKAHLQSFHVRRVWGPPNVGHMSAHTHMHSCAWAPCMCTHGTYRQACTCETTQHTTLSMAPLSHTHTHRLTHIH